MTRRLAGVAGLAVLAFAAVALAGAPRGPFEDIPFGTPREQVKAAVIEKLKIQSIQAFDGVELRGDGGVRLVDQPDAIVVQRYRLNGRAVDALLFFNANDRFFRVEYDGQARPVSYFRTATHDDALFFSKTLQKTYGAPTFQMNPKPVEMRPGSVGYFWRWTKARDTVYTAIVAGEEDFGAIAVVSDDTLMREAPAAPVASTTPPSDVPQERVADPSETLPMTDTGTFVAPAVSTAAVDTSTSAVPAVPEDIIESTPAADDTETQPSPVP